MKQSHIYQRMNDNRIVKGYIKLLRESDLTTAKLLFQNITLEAYDHPRYLDIKQIYEARLEHN